MSEATRQRIESGLPPNEAPFALAFSGGGDSLGLLKNLRDNERLAAVLHVDHGLREGSALEADQACELARSLGHRPVILRWTPPRGKTGLQEKARRARYGLMGDYCRANGIGSLLTAHHADDQAETVLMRVQRGSGWRGAAGIWPVRYAPVWPELAGITLYRPTLGLSQADLRGELGDLQPIQDPSNLNRNFARIRARQELSAKTSLTADMLALSGEMAAGLRADRNHMKAHLKGYHLTHEGQFSVPHLVSVNALALLAPIIGGQRGPASRLGMAEKRASLMSGKAVSIGEGCIGEWDGEILTLSRDPMAISGRKDRRVAPTAVPMAITPDPIIWDGRFLVSGSAGQLHPERRGLHVGFRVLYGRGVRVRNLVQERLEAALMQM